MADIDTTEAEWAPVRRLEKSDRALAGEGGVMNEQALALVKRDNWLKDKIEAFNAETGASLIGVENGGTLADYMNEYNVRAYGVMPGLSLDQSEGFQAALDAVPDGCKLKVPKGVYFAKNLKLTRGIILEGEGNGYWGSIIAPGYADCTTIVLSEDSESLLKIGDCTNTTNTSDLSAYVVGFQCVNIAFAGGQKTVSKALVDIEHTFAAYFYNCCFNYVNGSAIRLQWCYEPQFMRCHVRRIDATKGAGMGVIWIDDKYSAIAGDNNVNHFKFLAGHIEHHWNDVLHITPNASADYIQFQDNKFEMGRQNFDPTTAGTGDYLWSVFYLGRATRVDISHNHFANYGDYTGYRYMLTCGEDITESSNIYGYQAAFGRFADNHFANYDLADKYGSGKGVIARIRGISSFDIYNNQNDVTYADRRSEYSPGLFEVTSKSAQRLEYLTNTGATKNRAQATPYGKYTNGFIPVHQLITTDSRSFVADSASLSIAKTVIASSAANATLITVDSDLFKNYPLGVRIGIRARSASGAGKIQFASNSNTSASQTVGTTYATYSYSFSAADLKNDALTLSIKTSSTNAETVFIDGIYVIPLSEGCPGIQEPYYSANIAASGGTGSMSLPTTNNPNQNSKYTVVTSAGIAEFIVFNGAITVIAATENMSVSASNPNTASAFNVYLNSGSLSFLNNTTSTVSVRVFPLARY